MQQARYHVIFDLDRCGPAIQDAKAIDAFIRNVIGKIGMSILSGPVVCEGVPENPGLSGFAVLDFSHASVHTFTKTNEAMIDVFSCKPYDQETVRKIAREAFGTPESTLREKLVWWG